MAYPSPGEGASRARSVIRTTRAAVAPSVARRPGHLVGATGRVEGRSSDALDPAVLSPVGRGGASDLPADAGHRSAVGVGLPGSSRGIRPDGLGFRRQHGGHPPRAHRQGLTDHGSLAGADRRTRAGVPERTPRPDRGHRDRGRHRRRRPPRPPFGRESRGPAMGGPCRRFALPPGTGRLPGQGGGHAGRAHGAAGDERGGAARRGGRAGSANEVDPAGPPLATDEADRRCARAGGGGDDRLPVGALGRSGQRHRAAGRHQPRTGRARRCGLLQGANAALSAGGDRPGVAGGGAPRPPARHACEGDRGRGARPPWPEPCRARPPRPTPPTPGYRARRGTAGATRTRSSSSASATR